MRSVASSPSSARTGARAVARPPFFALLALSVACGGGGGGSGGGGGGGGGGGTPPASVVAVPRPELVDLAAHPGASPGQVTLRFTAPTPQASAYVVRHRVRSLDTPTEVALGTVTPHGVTPGAPGRAERLDLEGLEPGQTLQFVVSVVRGEASSLAGYPVACRVPGGPPAAPPGAIPLSGPATLAQAGATYVLTRDVTAPGTAFVVAARDVVLDLAGFTVTYGTSPGRAHGVYSEYLYGSGSIEVRNGRLVQGGADAAGSHAVWFRGGHQLRASRLDVTVRGPDTSGIVVSDGPTGDVRVDHNTVRCDTTVVTNRSYPGVAALFVETVTRGLQVDHNLVLSSPQWGIKLQGNATAGEATVHHNRVLGTRARVANAYMFGLYKPALDVFENEGAGESRGVHLDGVDGSGTSCDVHDNALTVADQPNDEYPDVHWVHGIKVEGATGTRLRRNAVRGVADAAHAEVRALDLDLEGASGVVVEENRVRAISTTAALRAHALEWTAGTLTSANDLVFRRNVLVATDRVVNRSWGARHGGLLRDNLFVRDLSLGPAHPFAFEYFDSSDALASHGHRVLDAVLPAGPAAPDLLDVEQWAGPGPYTTTREWTLAVRAVDGAGAAVAGASVVVRDRTGASVASGATDATGAYAATVVAHRIRNGPAVDARGPFSVSVTKAGTGSYVGPHAVDRRTALRVDLAAGTAEPDTTPPPPVAGLLGARISATRAYLRWDPADDPSGIAGYLVLLDGEPASVVAENQAFVSGLEPETTVALSVVALDRGGNASAASAPVSVTTGPEDRGP